MISLEIQQRYMIALAEDLVLRLERIPPPPLVVMRHQDGELQVNPLRGVQLLGRARMVQRLQALMRALRRIEAGVYGTCFSCGQQIAEARLELMPEAELCYPCAVVEERTC